MGDAVPLLEGGYGSIPLPDSKNKKTTKVRYYDNNHVGCWTRRKRTKFINKYYEGLEELQDLYEHDRILMSKADIVTPPEIERRPDRILAKLAVTLNVVLLFTNLTASVMSGSLAILSTFVDSLMDLTSSLILGISLWMIHNTNDFKYPRGRSRLELLSVVLCSVIMGIANMFIIMQSITSILSGEIHPEVNKITLGIMLGGSLVKGILMVVCYRRNSPSAKVLAMDMRNDIATSLVAIVSAYIGDRFWPYADPVGAILVCGLIALSWFHHALEQVPSLVGVRAQRENLSRILKISLDHDARIRFIDHVMVYHTGAEAIVELHIVMDEDLTLKITHDISHPLEKKLQQLDFVERAFVHCDYNCDGD